ncbi:MAG: LysE family transporter, partial [Corynebacterium sp.]|nr:LysE family transporter [Corynebacterium sp.]
MTIVLAGFALGISLIVAIGPQNAMLIKQGIKREHVGAAIITCLVSEVAMTLSGVAGVGFLVDNYPHVLTVLKYLGAAYLIYFTFTCFRDAFTSDATALTTDAAPTVSPQTISTFNGTAHLESSGGHRAASITDSDSLTAGGSTTVRTRPLTISPRGSAAKVILTALAFTWLNPAAYVDVVVMLGGIA